MNYEVMFSPQARDGRPLAARFAAQAQKFSLKTQHSEVKITSLDGLEHNGVDLILDIHPENTSRPRD